MVAGWSERTRPARVELRGRVVVAEPLNPSHSPSLFASLCSPVDDSLWTYRPMPRPDSLHAFEAIVAELSDPASPTTTFALIPVGDTAAGMASLAACAPAAGSVEISGILWSRAMQQTTAATEAIHLLLCYVFDDLRYRRVEWKCDCLNEPSRRAAQRLGFRYEGRFRQHMVTQGRNRDTDWFSLLDQEWPTVRRQHRQWLAPENFDEGGAQLHRLNEFAS